MGKQINDGGPAFPRDNQGDDAGVSEWGWTGMSLRDWFAGQTLSGIATSPAGTDHDIARACYAMADAMIRQREVARGLRSDIRISVSVRGGLFDWR